MINKDFFDTVLDRRNSMSRKWDDRNSLKEGGLPFWVADMDFACAPAITRALTERAQHPNYGYCLRYHEDSVTAFFKRRHGVLLAPDSVIMAPNVVSALRIAVHTCSEKEDKASLFAPVYGPFYDAISAAGREVIALPLVMDEHNAYHIDFEAFEQSLKSGVRLVLFCSPANPIGRLWTEEELKRLLALTRTYDACLVVDEIHADFALAGEFVPIHRLTDESDKVVSLYAANKTFNLAGLLQGYIFCKNKTLCARIKAHIHANGIESGNLFAMVANQTAFSLCDDWLDALIAYLKENRQTLLSECAKRMPHVKISPIHASYLAWLDLRYLPCDESRLKNLLYEKGIALTMGSAFGKQGEGFVRFNFGCPRQQMLAGLNILSEVILKEESHICNS